MGDQKEMYKLPKILNLPEELDLPTNMYSMKRIFTLPENVGIEQEMYPMGKVINLPENMNLPTNMYAMKKILTPTASDQVNESMKDDSAPLKSNITSTSDRHYKELENRQKNILERLKLFKEKLDSLVQNPISSVVAINPELNELPFKKLLSSQDGKHLDGVIDLIKDQLEDVEQLGHLQQATIVPNSGTIHDIVIGCNASQPPFSILAIKKSLEQSGNKVLLSNTIHSSVENVDDKLLRLFSRSGYRERSEHNIALTIIWKKQQYKSLMVSPISHNLIEGEANILRYISRMLPSTAALNYEANKSAAQISNADNWMDIIQAKLLHGCNKEQLAALKQINAKLGTSSFICGSEYGLVDIFCWSVLLQLKPTISLPNHVSIWFLNVSNLYITTAIHGTEVVDSKQSLSTDSSSCVNQFVDRKMFESLLTRIGIKFVVKDHPAVFTVEAMMKYVHGMEGLHMKNLFLKDKKKNLYLIAARHDAKINLSDVAKQIGVKELRFGDEQVMFDILGVKQGCVTLYALVNDKKNQVQLILDSESLNPCYKYVYFHPMTNEATLGISPCDLNLFLKEIKHEAKFVLKFT